MLSPIEILILLIGGFVLWRAINHRRGRQLVATAALLVIAGVVLYFFTGKKRQALESQPAVLFEASRVSQAPAINLGSDRAPAEPKPAWVDRPPQQIDGEYEFTVTAGPYSSPEECQKHLTQELRKGVEAFIDNFLELPGAGRRVDLDMATIREQLVKDQYFETVPFGFGPMNNLYALVRIDRPTQELIQQRHQRALAHARLGYSAGAFGLVLVLLATAFGYLKLDTLTKGYYSGRLKLAATAVILTAAAATALVVRQADPAAGWPLGLPFTQSSQSVEL